MLFRHDFRVYALSIALVALCCTNFAISELRRRCSDYDYKIFFPKLNTERYIKTIIHQDFGEYTICQWAKPNYFSGGEQSYASYATSSNTPDLDRLFISYNINRRSFMYAWRDENGGFHILRSDEVNLNLNEWQHICFERGLNPGSIAFYVNGAFLSIHEDVGINEIHPGGGIFMLGEEQDSLGGGFDPNQAFYGEIAHYNMWNYTLGSTVIAQLHSRIGGTENGNLLSWPDMSTYHFEGDARLLRPSPIFKLSAFNCSWSNWRCNSDFCVDAYFICENKPMELRIESCYHYYMCQFPTCPTPTLLPSNATAHNTSSTSVFVQWGYDETELFYRAVRGYILIAREQENSSIIAVNTTLSTSLTSITLQNLKKFTSYIVQVAALSSKDGPFVNITVRTAEDTPSRSPVNLTTVDRYSRSVYLNWGYVPGEFLHGILRAYKIRYYQTSLGNWTAKTVDITAQSSSRRNSSVSVMEIPRDVEIGDLIPYTNYSFQLTAFTIGDGVWTDWLSYTTDEEVPKSPPLNITVQNTSSTSLLVNWSPVPVHLRDGFIRGYWMTYQRDDLANGNTTRLLIDPWLTSFETQNLRKYTMYNVKMTAFTIKGESNESDIVTCSTDEDAPSRPAVNLTTVDRYSRFVYINWGYVPEGFLNGILRAYKIRYYQTSLGNWTAKTVDITVQSSSRRKRAVSVLEIPRDVEIGDLIPYTNYSFQLTAFTIGDGVWTDWLSYTTDEEVPKSPPLNITVQNTSSTSLLVNWSPVPVHLRHGFIRGYWMTYQRDDLPNGNTTRLLTDPWLTSFEIQNLRKYTMYNVKMTAFTIKGESNESDIVTCSTDEDVPGLPPPQLNLLVTGLTSLSISWGPVPLDFHHGIILGYELRYKTPEGLQFVFNFTINETTMDIADLNDYSLYPISVSAFTRKGLGPWGKVTALTDTPSPYQPPVKLSAISRSHLSALNVTWTRVNLTEMFGLFEIKAIQIYYQEISTGFVKAEDETENTTVCNDVEIGHCLIPGLKPFTLYRLRASWINRYGLGPFSKAVEAETCRCQERFTTNWYNLPPYVSLKYKDGNILQKGIMATVLQDAITYCCLECSTQNPSILDLRRNGLNESADASSEEQMRARIGQETDISFPVYGHKKQDRYGGVFAYTPVVESPGVAIIVSSSPGFSVAEEVTKKTFGFWPLLLLSLVLAALAGAIMWVMETNQNPEHFPTSTMSGIGNGFWWAYITMTTVGYGDRAPVTIQGRIVAVAWTLVGLVITGFVVGALTASLNEIVEIAVSSSSTVYGSKVGAIANTSEYRLAMRMNAKMDEKVQYTSLEELYKDLLAGEIAAIFLDVYRMGDFKEYLGNPKVRLGKVIDNEMAYGVVWNGRSEALTKCLSQYTKSRQAKISNKVENTTSAAELKTDDSRLEIVLSVFDPESKIFVKTLRCSLILLGVFVLFGLIWECIRRRKVNNKIGVLGKPTNLIEPDDLAMFQSLFTTFHIEIKSKARKLLRRHIKELDVFWKTEQGTSRSTLS